MGTTIVPCNKRNIWLECLSQIRIYRTQETKGSDRRDEEVVDQISLKFPHDVSLRNSHSMLFLVDEEFPTRSHTLVRRSSKTKAERLSRGRKISPEDSDHHV